VAQELVTTPQPQTHEEALQTRQLDLFEKSLENERERIATQKAMTGVALEAIKASDIADSRQHEFHTKRIEIDAKESERQDIMAESRHKRGFKAIFGIGIGTVVLVAFLIYMAFWGALDQKETALTILGILGAVLAGIGIGELISSAVKRIWGD